MIVGTSGSLLAETDAIADIPPAPSADLGMTFVKMITTFAILILLLFGTYWLIKKLIRIRLEKGVGEASIQVLEKKMISAKTILYLIEVDGKKVLIAESHLEVKRLENFSSHEKG